VDDDLKRFNTTPSGRSSIIKPSEKKFHRGFVVRPDQMIELFHDTQPSLPIPKDAEFKGIGISDEGSNSKIQFFFSSVIAPQEHCLEMKPHYFFKVLLDLCMGLMPMDSELDGIEISPRFTMILLRVKSSHWPPAISQTLPLWHLRYEGKRLLVQNPEEAFEFDFLTGKLKERLVN
jgi:hypothetical protein